MKLAGSGGYHKLVVILILDSDTLKRRLQVGDVRHVAGMMMMVMIDAMETRGVTGWLGEVEMGEERQWAKFECGL